MKILHCCLGNHYIDDYGYQENILPKMHKLQDYDVAILASTETFLDAKLTYIKSGSYISNDGIPVTRIPYIKWMPHSVAKKLRIYEGVSSYLENFQPDIIFIHNPHFISIKEIVKYAKNKQVVIYADNHADFMNSAKNWLSKNILHRIIYKWSIKLVEPYVTKFWGVTPSRKDFLIDFYKVNSDKVGLLVMGVDDSVIDFENIAEIREKTRERLGVQKNEFIIITGGRIDKRKNIHILIDAINDLKSYNIKLIIFGKIDEELKPVIEKYFNNPNILILGWKHTNEINNLFFASDLAIFPGTHSVLWEQAVGCGLPALFKYHVGYDHLDLGGNCLFIEVINKQELKKKLLSVFENEELYKSMSNVAKEKGVVEFSYSEIAKRAIEA